MNETVEKYDLIVVGGGTSGVAAAITAARQGVRTLLIEKNSFLGGAMTGGLVVPMMKNSYAFSENSLLSEVLRTLRDSSDSIIYEDGNPGWFNPEMMKCVLDDFCLDAGVDILFDTVLVDVEVNGNSISKIICFSQGEKICFVSKQYIDASGDAVLSKLAGVSFDIGQDGQTQPFSLRFNMAGVDIGKFASWIKDFDVDRKVTTVFQVGEELHFSTAYTQEGKDWALCPLFEEGVEQGIITESDAKYFQIFTIAGQKGAVAFNCPRIDLDLDPTKSIDVSKALLEGRKSLRRIVKFCKMKFPGFENSYVSNIACNLGVRDSRRIEGMYELGQDDFGEKFENIVAASDYPFDIHSNNSDNSMMSEKKYYEIPLECLQPKQLVNLFVIGRCISADFKMQSSLRIQPTCFAMGEYIGGHISDIIIN